VTGLDTLGRRLESAWLEGIPLAAAMQIEVVSANLAAADAAAALELAVRAPLAANRNVHATAFAGSLFSICVLTGWGVAWLALERGGARGTIVIADSRIRYRKAVTAETIECRCRLDATAADAAVASLAGKGRAALSLACTIDAGGKLAVAFEGDYVIHAPH
jgi:thioesterase domain-containing protein